MSHGPQRIQRGIVEILLKDTVIIVGIGLRGQTGNKRKMLLVERCKWHAVVNEMKRLFRCPSLFFTISYYFPIILSSSPSLQVTKTYSRFLNHHHSHHQVIHLRNLGTVRNDRYLYLQYVCICTYSALCDTDNWTKVITTFSDRPDLIRRKLYWLCFAVMFTVPSYNFVWIR